MNRAIFLDRDGVLNVDYLDYVLTPERIQVYPRSIIAVEMLKKEGYKIFVITNQSCISRGLATREQIDEINKRINIFYGNMINEFYVCPHQETDNCDCRKPKPGLILQAAKDFNIELNRNVFMVGDSHRDIEAASDANILPIFLRTTIRNLNSHYAFEANDLLDAVEKYIL